jgi:excisionase family DNA binding protein
MNALLTIDDVAELLGVSKQLIYSWRHKKLGPPAIALEGRLLRWRLDDVDGWLEAGRSDGGQP